MSSVIASRLKKLRLDTGLTQKDVFTGVHMSQTLYQKYESGQSAPGAEKLIALADFYGVSADYILGRTDDPRMRSQPPQKRFMRSADEV